MLRADFYANSEPVAWIIPIDEATVRVTVVKGYVTQVLTALSNNTKLFEVLLYSYANFIGDWTVQLSAENKMELVNIIQQATDSVASVEQDEETEEKS